MAAGAVSPERAFVAAQAKPSQKKVETDRFRRVIQALAARQQVQDRVSLSTLPSSTTLGRKHYPRIVELKIAGRSDRQIAERFKVRIFELKPHVAKAMAMYRDGKITINSGEAVSEAERAGEEKAEEAIQKMTEAYRPSFEFGPSEGTKAAIAESEAPPPEISVTV